MRVPAGTTRFSAEAFEDGAGEVAASCVLGAVAEVLGGVTGPCCSCASMMPPCAQSAANARIAATVLILGYLIERTSRFRFSVKVDPAPGWTTTMRHRIREDAAIALHGFRRMPDISEPDRGSARSFYITE